MTATGLGGGSREGKLKAAGGEMEPKTAGLTAEPKGGCSGRGAGETER